ncbi:hypothetical protein MMC31_003374 [Peltigera leucophlebia]|nr:hypothetical protein [Peltigera leucophlebia]
MMEAYQSESEGEEDIGDVSDILKLMAVLRKVRVDREKISVVGAFLAQAGDNFLYLCDNMAEIMNLLIYHTSRLQPQSNLYQPLEDAKNWQEKNESAARETVDKEKARVAQRVSNLIKAVRAADEHVEDHHRPNQRRELKDDDGNGGAANEAGREHTAKEEDQISEAITDEKRGTPNEAGVSEHQGILSDNGREDHQDTTTPTAKENSKGKEL